MDGGSIWLGYYERKPLILFWALHWLQFAGKPSRFDSLKCEWGFDKFISLEEFEEPTNGYLVKDTSIFGVEVYVSTGGSSRLGESHSISKVGNISGKYKWVITKFSELGLHRDSDEFVVGGYIWHVHDFS